MSASPIYSDNQVPTMTSNTSPSGIASASSEYDHLSRAWTGFDSQIGNSHYWTSNTNKGWLAYEFNTPKVIAKYTISPIGLNGYVNRLPKNWTFEGSNDDVNWSILDQQTNVTTWLDGTKKEFTLSNTKSFLKYRINISTNNGGTLLSIGELEMMVDKNAVQAPTLTAVDVNREIVLNWNSIPNAISYTVKKSTTTGGPYTTVADNVYGTSFTDKAVQINTAYYYVVSAKTVDGESGYSNEATATPKGNVTPPQVEGERAILVITLNTGLEKEFDLSMAEVTAFIDWYETKALGTGPATFAINKHNNNKGPFAARKAFIVFDKVLSFEVDGYNVK